MTSLSVERTADTGFVDTEGIDVREIRAALTAKAPQQVAPQQEQPASAPVRQRDRYIDTLRAVALVRVMTYHSFGWAWLPLLFPSMGIMFALAGSLVAASLDRSPGNPWRVLRKRTVRLLPPVWLFGLVVVPVMLVAGWTHTVAAGSPLNVRTLLLWVLPISDPHTLTTKARLDLPPDLKGVFPGMFARAHFVVGRATKLVIPNEAVVRRSEVTAVYVLPQQGQAQLRQVRLGVAAGKDGVEVLAGLRPGERVSLEPVKTGMVVKQAVQ